MAEAFHEPVLAEEVLALLEKAGAGLFLDGTLGGGGHALRLLERCRECRLVAVDRDPEALAEAARALRVHADRVRFVRARFDRAVREAGLGAEELAGALLDLGLSSHQLDTDRRGFAYRRGLPLDMRMGGEDGTETAADLLNGSTEETLYRIFREYGEEPRARKLARAVVRRRRKEPFRTSDDLVGLLSAVLGRSATEREKARVFQALRIAVNRELEALEEGLPALREALRPGGVLAVIAYHSLEDRIVKVAFREWSRSCVCPPGIPVCTCRGRPLGEPLTSGPVRPSEEEVERNPRGRSALLRAWRKAA